MGEAISHAPAPSPGSDQYQYAPPPKLGSRTYWDLAPRPSGTGTMVKKHRGRVLLIILIAVFLPVAVPVLIALGGVVSSDDDPGTVPAVLLDYDVGDCLLTESPGDFDNLRPTSCADAHDVQVITTEPALRTADDLRQRCELAFFEVVANAQDGGGTVQIPVDAQSLVIDTGNSLESACAVVSPSTGLRGSLGAG